MKNIVRRIIFFVLLGVTVPSFAQNEDETEEWFLNGRPECNFGGSGNMVGKQKIGSQSTAPLRALGVQHIPVVLVAFQDKAFSVANSTEELQFYYNKFCNGTMNGVRYTGHGSYGSIRDYFVEQSDSLFLPEFTIIGPVTLDEGYAYYGANTYNDAGALLSRDKNFGSFTKESIAKAMEKFENWEIFDNDGNGTIDMVFFLFAGMGENNSKDPDCIWPKEERRSTTINDKIFACSAVTCELRPIYNNEREITGAKADGIGVFIHELGHALGLPDFYDTQYKAFGMDIWSIMDYGEYCNNGYSPVGYTAYERDFMGWQHLKELTEPCVLTLSCFADGGCGYKIINEANPNEYYIIENRQSRGWDTSLCRGDRHGLQVTHVDYAPSSWNGNSVNTDISHQRMTIVAANNLYKGTNSATSSQEWANTLAGNLYPGDTFNYNLTDESVPAAEVFTGGFMHKPLRFITEDTNGDITVCFRTHGKIETPVIRGVEDIADDNAFTVVWDYVENATKYVCELYDNDILLHRDVVTSNKIRYKDIQSIKDLKYRVKGMADSPEDYIESEWSEFMNVENCNGIFYSKVGEDNKSAELYIYDLTGRRVTKPQRGIYIQDGKKKAPVTGRRSKP